MQIAAVFACVRYIAETIGALPWSVYVKRPNGGGRDEYLNSPLWRVLHTRPNPEMSAMSFKETMRK